MSDYPHRTACPRCKAKYASKPELFGSDPQCAFVTGEFDGENWQCATMDTLREINEEAVGYDGGSHGWNLDENACVLSAGEGDFLLMSWYKRRGRTQWAQWLDGGTDPKPLTAEMAEQVIAHHATMKETK